jgi:hypothetical protein
MNRIERLHDGSSSEWKEEYVAAGLTSKQIGWVLLIQRANIATFEAEQGIYFTL